MSTSECARVRAPGIWAGVVKTKATLQVTTQRPAGSRGGVQARWWPVSRMRRTAHVGNGVSSRKQRGRSRCARLPRMVVAAVREALRDQRSGTSEHKRGSVPCVVQVAAKPEQEQAAAARADGSQAWWELQTASWRSTGIRPVSRRRSRRGQGVEAREGRDYFAECVDGVRMTGRESRRQRANGPQSACRSTRRGFFVCDWFGPFL